MFRYDPDNKCPECGIRTCERTQEELLDDPGILPDGTAWACCPHKVLLDDHTTYTSILRAIEHWRHWDKGNLSAFVEDASDGLSRSVLWVDEEVGEYKAFLENQAYEKAKSEGNR